MQKSFFENSFKAYTKTPGMKFHHPQVMTSQKLLKASFGIQKLKREYKKMVPTWQVFWHGCGSNYPKNVLSKKFSKKFYKIPKKTSMTKFCLNEKCR